MNNHSRLEQRYRRLVALYPAAYRAEYGDELLTVLMACSRVGQRRPGLPDSFALLVGAVQMRLRPRQGSARTISGVVGLMYAAAALEFAALATWLLTLGSVKAAVFQHDPGTTTAHWQAYAHGETRSMAIGVPVMAALWLVVAWGSKRGWRWPRIAALALFALTTVSIVAALGQDAPTYAPVDLAVGGVLWLVTLLTVLLAFDRQVVPRYDAERVEA
jgi:hypothetical protein